MNASNVDLFRVPVEEPTRAKLTGQNLVYTFAADDELGDPFLLGKILMCRRDFGYGCMNVFEHLENNLKRTTGNPVQAEALNDYRRLLRNYARTLTHDGEFCRAYLLDEATRACR